MAEEDAFQPAKICDAQTRTPEIAFSAPSAYKFECHLAGALAPLSRAEAPKPYNWLA